MLRTLGPGVEARKAEALDKDFSSLGPQFPHVGKKEAKQRNVPPTWLHTAIT